MTTVRVIRRVGGGMLIGMLAGIGLAGAVHADTALPSIPPYIPDVPYPYPGSYLYAYNLIPVYGPALNDARGIRATATADPAMIAQGMPGSQLGQAANKSNMLGTYTSMKNNISAGPAPQQTVQPGISPAAGNQMPLVENPDGVAPTNAPGAESAQPTAVPVAPGNSQVLESADGQSASAAPAPSPAPPPPPGPTAVQVWPQTPGFAPGAFGTGPGPVISAGQ